jgi:hypothetical protein
MSTYKLGYLATRTCNQQSSHLRCEIRPKNKMQLHLKHVLPIVGLARFVSTNSQAIQGNRHSA